MNWIFYCFVQVVNTVWCLTLMACYNYLPLRRRNTRTMPARTLRFSSFFSIVFHIEKSTLKELFEFMDNWVLKYLSISLNAFNRRRISRSWKKHNHNKELLDCLSYGFFFQLIQFSNERVPQLPNQFSIVNVVDVIWKKKKKIQQNEREWRRENYAPNSVKMSPKIELSRSLALCVALKDKQIAEAKPDIDFANCISDLTFVLDGNYYKIKYNSTWWSSIIWHCSLLLRSFKNDCQESSFTVKQCSSASLSFLRLRISRVVVVVVVAEDELSWFVEQQNAVENKIRDKQQTSIAIME